MGGIKYGCGHVQYDTDDETHWEPGDSTRRYDCDLRDPEGWEQRRSERPRTSSGHGTSRRRPRRDSSPDEESHEPMYTGKDKKMIGKTQAYVDEVRRKEAESRQKRKANETPEESRARKDHENLLLRESQAKAKGKTLDREEDARKLAARRDPNRETRYGRSDVPRSQWTQTQRDDEDKGRRKRAAEKKSKQ